ncbi:MAG: glycosyltransferase [Chitinophagaceae bacterium]|nr:glycosyltransferase [Chitinophagaceae bacterium]
MNVLVLGAFGKGALENFYVDGFYRQGIVVDKFDITKDYYDRISRTTIDKILNKVRPAIYFRPINLAILDHVRDKNYDVILIFKGLTIFPDTVRQLKRHAKLLCCYNPDHPFQFYSPGSGNKNISDSIELYDVYINYSQKVTAQLKNQFRVEAATIPFGYDDREIEVYENDPLGEKVLFAGAFDEDRAKFLAQLPGSTLAIYGDEKWRTRTNAYPELSRNYAGRSLYGDEYKTSIGNSLAVLNIMRKQNLIEGSHNMRTFEVPGYAGVMLSQRTEEQSYFFEEDREAIYFDTIEELKDKITFLRNNPSAVRAIKQAAHRRSTSSGYTYYDRSKEMTGLFKGYLK